MIQTQIPRRPDEPTPGFYRTRLIKGGPWVPARIMCHDGMWTVLVLGKPTASAASERPWHLPWMERVAFSTAITQDEYLALMAQHEQPNDQLADPKTRVDWRRGNPVF